GFSNRALRPLERVVFAGMAALVMAACLSSQWQWPVYAAGIAVALWCWRPRMRQSPMTGA
ncbi:MAG: hypothetical protein ACO31Z_08345, partial [Litorivicinaceae bacterium]